MPILLRRCVLLAPVLAALFTVSGPAAGEPDDSSGTPATAAEMDEFVRERMDAIGVPGVAYAIVSPDGITHAGAFGDDGDGRHVTASTPFLWGSEAKPVTATLVMQLVEDGRLGLDEPVTTYLPDFRFSDRRLSDEITIRHLVAQTGGVPGDMDLTDRFDEGRRPADVLPELAERDLEAEPGAEHIYSSVNYLILAAVIEKVTDRPFVDVLDERVLQPAGMDDAITTPDQAEQRLPPGHRFVLGDTMPFSSPFDPAGTAYGYLGGTLEDAAAFVRANLGDADTLLGRSRRELMYRGEIPTGEDRTYGLGWRTWPIDGTDSPMVWHSGAAPGYFASMILLPEKNRGIVVLQNAYGSFQEDEVLQVSFGLAQLMYGEDDPADAGTDPMYWAILGGFGVIAAALLGLVARAVWLLLRPREPDARRRSWRLVLGIAGWVVPLLAILYLFAVGLPAYYGLRLGQLALWAPDLAWLAYGILGVAALLLVLRLAIAVRIARIRTSG